MPPSPVPPLQLPDSPVSSDSFPLSAPHPDSCVGDSTNPSATSKGVELPITFDPLPEQSVRTALILDRFSTNCPIVYCSNDSFLSTTVVMGRSFFDFVTKKDESLVRSWIDAVKGWGVNERGQPSDGGFGFGKFHLFVQGRDSRCLVPLHFASQDCSRIFSDRYAEPAASRNRHSSTHHSTSRGQSRTASLTAGRPRVRNSRPPLNGEEIPVDSIFSAHSDGLIVILRHSL